MKKLFSLVLIVIFVVLLSVCFLDEDNKVKVVINIGLDEVIWKVVEQVVKDKYYFDVEVVFFNDYVLFNEVLNNKDVDVNVFQILLYFEVQLKECGYKFVVVGKIFVFFIVVYFYWIKNISELFEGVMVIIFNEIIILGCSLLLFQVQGLFKLKLGVGYLFIMLDIIDNLKQLKIVEVDILQLICIFDDLNVSLLIININFFVQVGLLVVCDGLFMEGLDFLYVNVIVVCEDNKDSKKIQELKVVFQISEVVEKVKEVYKGDVIKGW